VKTQSANQVRANREWHDPPAGPAAVEEVIGSVHHRVPHSFMQTTSVAKECPATTGCPGHDQRY
jgi:hypothetical protein